MNVTAEEMRKHAMAIETMDFEIKSEESSELGICETKVQPLMTVPETAQFLGICVDSVIGLIEDENELLPFQYQNGEKMIKISDAVIIKNIRDENKEIEELIRSGCHDY